MTHPPYRSFLLNHLNNRFRRPCFHSPGVVSSINDLAVMGDTIEHSGGHLLVTEDLGPLPKGEIGGDDHRGLLVEFGDQVTNHMTFGSTTIAAIYKDRWQIEIFFKTIKQNLRIKTFVGASPNALMIQIWTALIAVLILKYLKFRSLFQWSLSNLVALLRYSLFTYRDLWAWMNQPFEPPPISQMNEQRTLHWTAL